MHPCSSLHTQLWRQPRLLATVALACLAIGPALAEPVGAPSPASPVVAILDQADTDSPDALIGKITAQLQRQPDDIEGWRILARAYVLVGRPDDALTAQRKVVALHPDDPQDLVDLARAIAEHHGRQFDAEAESLLQRAIAKDPGHAVAHAMFGKLEMDRGQLDAARQHWQAALAHLDAAHPLAIQLRQILASTAPADASTSTSATPSSTTSSRERP